MSCLFTIHTHTQLHKDERKLNRSVLIDLFHLVPIVFLSGTQSQEQTPRLTPSSPLVLSAPFCVSQTPLQSIPLGGVQIKSTHETLRLLYN